MEQSFGGGEFVTNTETQVPGWFVKYTRSLSARKADLLTEVNEISEKGLGDLKRRLGGDIRDLPYEVLETLFIGGSGKDEVAQVLRKKREEYLKKHPEKSRGVQGATQGVITFDGRFIPQSAWITASESEKRGVLVGSTCFHYNSDTPGMGSSPNDRW